jgi:hypothetical protein
MLTLWSPDTAGVGEAHRSGGGRRSRPGSAEPTRMTEPPRLRGGSADPQAEVAGIEPTGRGSPVPLVLKTRGPTRRPFTSGSCVSRLEFPGHPRSPGGGPDEEAHAARDRARPRRRRGQEEDGGLGNQPVCERAGEPRRRSPRMPEEHRVAVGEPALPGSSRSGRPWPCRYRRGRESGPRAVPRREGPPGTPASAFRSRRRSARGRPHPRWPKARRFPNTSRGFCRCWAQR